jgi:hypothetical protein
MRVVGVFLAVLLACAAGAAAGPADVRERARALRLRREARAGVWTPEHFAPGAGRLAASADVVEVPDDAAAGDVLVAGAGKARVDSALQCKTLSTRGPTCWGWAIVYCPEGWVMTGGGS